MVSDGMTVLLMGAGASKAYQGSSTAKRMPIAADFFSVFESLAIYNHPWVLRQKLWHYLHTERHVDPEHFLGSGINIEELHSEIEAALFNVTGEDAQIKRLIHFAAYTELSNIFACVVNSIQNGAVSTPHELLARRLKPQDVVLTFNWDTLMDRALAETTTWRTDFGYGFIPRRIYRNEWQAPQRHIVTDSPRLIKLHGSTNWITSYPTCDEHGVKLTQISPSDSVWVYEFSDDPYDCYAGRFMPGYGPFSFGYYPPNLLDDPGESAPDGHVFFQVRPRHPLMPTGTSGDSGLASVPLIIPPVKQKSYGLYASLFDDLWQSAEDALVIAERIVIIGYSFPQTDLKSHSLFKRAFTQRLSMPRVVIVDPNPERIAEIVRFEFGIRDDHLTVIKDYFSEHFDLDALGL